VKVAFNPEPVTLTHDCGITSGRAFSSTLQSWAVAGNPTYENGMAPMLQQAPSVYNSKFAPFYLPTRLPPYPILATSQGYGKSVGGAKRPILAFNSPCHRPKRSHRATPCAGDDAIPACVMRESCRAGAQGRCSVFPRFHLSPFTTGCNGSGARTSPHRGLIYPEPLSSGQGHNS